MENLPKNESEPVFEEGHGQISPEKEVINDLATPPTEGLLGGITGEQLLRIREAITTDPQLMSYYNSIKERLIKESGKYSIHRGQVLNEMHKTLSTGGDNEKMLAKKLEGFVTTFSS
ncbi:MAG: hypothetical protein WCS89_03640 [Candidatus Paceibacterota bacterium]